MKSKDILLGLRQKIRKAAFSNQEQLVSENLEQDHSAAKTSL